jgi:WD40 repeat protein
MLCDADSLAVVACLDSSWSPVAVCDYSPDGARIMAGYATDVALYSRRSASPDTLKLWNATTGQFLQTLDIRDNAVRRGGFSPDGLLLASGCDDGTVRIWESASGTIFAALQGHDGQVVACGFSPDGTSLLSVANDGSVKVWSASTGEETYAFWIPGRATAGAWDRSGHSVIVGDEFGQVCLLTLDGDPRSSPYAAAR